ncbi:hypothetical protein DXG01_014785 [Tephrocybe rancida]|nr:hypothetical protein DXG01_014785 [Tephrocybe rancida]
MLVDMLAYAIDNPRPSTVVLISGDRDFAYAMSTLRLRGFKIVLISPGMVHRSLKAQASEYLDWNIDVLRTDAHGDRNSSNSGSSVGAETYMYTPVRSKERRGQGSLNERASAAPSAAHNNDSVKSPLRRDTQAPPAGLLDTSPQKARQANVDQLPSAAALSPQNDLPRSEDGIETSRKATPTISSISLFSDGTAAHSDEPNFPSVEPPVVKHESENTGVHRGQNNTLRPAPPFVPSGLSSAHPSKPQIQVSSPLAPKQFTPSENRPRPSLKIKPGNMVPSASASSHTMTQGVDDPNARTTTPLLLPLNHPPAPSIVAPAAQQSSKGIPSVTPVVPPAATQIVPGIYKPLVESLQYWRTKGVYLPLRSQFALGIGARHPGVYYRAGVKKFTQYAAMAEAAGIIELGGKDGAAWISLRPEWHDTKVFP